MDKFYLVIFLFVFMSLSSCDHDGYEKSVDSKSSFNVLFLHHSTGNNIYRGAFENEKADIEKWFFNFNSEEQKKINFVEQVFPKSKVFRYISGYGWSNYPYDYYNIWVKNGDKKSYKYEPTLKTLTPLWDVIVIKHCYPVSSIKEDGVESNIDSDHKTIANYRLQYEALRKEMLKYQNTKFILWTGAALTEKSTKVERAKRANQFFTWVKEVWDKPGDNIYLWDFYDLETEGGIYLKSAYASGEKNSHPNREFSSRVAPLFCQRVVDVALYDGINTDLHGCHVTDSILFHKN